MKKKLKKSFSYFFSAKSLFSLQSLFSPAIQITLFALHFHRHYQLETNNVWCHVNNVEINLQRKLKPRQHHTSHRIASSFFNEQFTPQFKQYQENINVYKYFEIFFFYVIFVANSFLYILIKKIYIHSAYENAELFWNRNDIQMIQIY